MKHPITEWLGGDSTIVIHRPVLRALKAAGAVSPIEAAMLLEHIVYRHRLDSSEWVVLPYAEIDAELMIPERTARRHLDFLKAQGLIITRRELQSHDGKVCPFLLYQVQQNALAELLGFSIDQPAKMAGSVLREVAGTEAAKMAGSSFTYQIEHAGQKKDASARAAGAQRSAKNAEKKERPVNPFFDALVLALYPQGAGMNASHIAKVAALLSGAGWTPDQVTQVLEWRRRDAFWQKKLTLPSFEKYAEDWKRESGVARRVPAAAEPDGDDEMMTRLFTGRS